VSPTGDHSPVLVKFIDFVLTFPGISHGGINTLDWMYTEVHRGDLCVLLSEYCGTIGSPSCACLLDSTQVVY